MKRESTASQAEGTAWSAAQRGDRTGGAAAWLQRGPLGLRLEGGFARHAVEQEKGSPEGGSACVCARTYACVHVCARLYVYVCMHTVRHQHDQNMV